jgi:hypothetical protein
MTMRQSCSLEADRTVALETPAAIDPRMILKGLRHRNAGAEDMLQGGNDDQLHHQWKNG